jgi:hypothetical protein
VGPSAALNVAAATKLALRPGNRNSGKVIVTILCDGGGRYTSKLYNQKWLEENNLVPSTQPKAETKDATKSLLWSSSSPVKPNFFIVAEDTHN